MSAASEKETRGAAPDVDGATSTGMLDLNLLRLPQDFAEKLGVKKLLAQVQVTKPRKDWFFRTRSGPEWRMPVAMIVLKEEGESYVVQTSLAAGLTDDVVNFELVTAINRQGMVFLWPLRIPNSSGDAWAHSAIVACARAETHWVKTRANRQVSAYDVFEAEGELGEPEWPEESFDALFRIAFRDRVITSIDHSVIQKLKGAL